MKSRADNKADPALEAAIIGGRRLISVFAHPLAGLFDFTPDLYYFVKDRHGRFVDANLPFIEMFGAHRLEDIVGKTDLDFSPRELADHFMRDDRAVMRTGKAITNRVELVPDSRGNINWNVTSKVPLYDERGVIAGIAGLTRGMSKATISLKRHGAMTAVMEYMAAHYHESVTVRDMASTAHMSVSQFERRFKALFHMTPMHYLVKYRINRACGMLTGGTAKITEIATQCGFYDHSHFTRQFIKTIGISPREYRRQYI